MKTYWLKSTSLSLNQFIWPEESNTSSQVWLSDSLNLLSTPFLVCFSTVVAGLLKRAVKQIYLVLSLAPLIQRTFSLLYSQFSLAQTMQVWLCLWAPIWVKLSLQPPRSSRSLSSPPRLMLLQWTKTHH